MTIKELKTIGHFLLNSYIRTQLRVKNDKKHYNKEKRKAYHKLAQLLHTDAYKCHFANMETEDEVLNAIYVLNQMIKSE